MIFSAWKWIKSNTLLIGLAIISLMWAIIEGMRRDKEKVKADLAEGEAKAIKRAIKAQNDEREVTSELLQEHTERRRRNIRTDIK